MADDPSSAPPEQNGQGVRNMRVQRQTVREANFTRADIKTGEVKSIEGDILSDIKKAITEQTTKLSQVFEKEIKDCCKAASGGGGGDAKVLEQIKDGILGLGSQLGSAGGGGDGGGGGGDGGDTSDLAGQARIRKIASVLDDVGFQLNELGEVVGFKVAPTVEKFEEIMRENVNETVRKFGANMTDLVGKLTRWDTVTTEVVGRFNKAMEMSSSSMLDLTDAIGVDVVKAFTGNLIYAGDSLVETADQVRKAVNDGITSPMRLVQGNIRDVASEFKRLRGEAEDFGLDLYARIGWREQNELLTSLVDEQRRGSIIDDFRSFETRERAMEQLKFMTMVADNTGMSLEQLMQMSKEQSKNLEELQALGIISQEQAETFKMMSKSAPPQVQDFLAKIAESSGSTAIFAQKFPDIFEDLTKLGQQDLVERITQLSESGLQGTDLANALHDEMQGALGGVAGTFGKEAAAVMFQGREIQGLIGATNQMAKFQEGIGKQSPFLRVWREATDFFVNTWPIQTLASISALTFNTAAIVANTITHASSAGLFGAITGKLGRVGSMLSRLLGLGGAAAGGGGAAGGISKGMLGKMGNILKGAAKIGGGVVGAGLVAKDVYDVATGDTSGGNIGALIGSGIGGVIGGGIGSLAGGVGAIPGAAIGAGLGNAAGEWVGGMLSAGEAVDKSTAPRTRDAARTGGGAQQAVAMQIARQTDILGAINTKMERSIAIQTDIATGVNKIGFGGPGIGGKVATGSGGPRPIFAGSPSMKS